MKHLFNKYLITGMLGWSMMLGVNVLNAQSIDTSKAKVGFKAFKTPQKTGVDGTFDKVVFKFPKKDDSIVSVLEGASATMEGVNVNLNDDSRNATVRDAFFALFKKDKKGKQLEKTCETQHEKLTWSQVEINFTAPIK